MCPPRCRARMVDRGWRIEDRGSWMADEEAGKTFHFRASGRSAHAKANAACSQPGAFSKHGLLLARAAGRSTHGLRREARSHVACLPRLAAGRDSVPPAAVPMQSECSVPPARRLLQAWAATWHALRDAARTACGRRHAATWRGCRVSRQAVTACLRPLCPCKSECSVRPARRIL